MNGMYPRSECGSLMTPREILEELTASNMDFSEESVIDPPRWTIPNDALELQRTASCILVLRDEAIAKDLIAGRRKLFFNGAIPTTRQFIDRKSAHQCTNCQSYDHRTAHCKSCPICSICA